MLNQWFSFNWNENFAELLPTKQVFSYLFLFLLFFFIIVEFRRQIVNGFAPNSVWSRSFPIRNRIFAGNYSIRNVDKRAKRHKHIKQETNIRSASPKPARNDAYRAQEKKASCNQTHLMLQIYSAGSFDFIFFCALERILLMRRDQNGR